MDNFRFHVPALPHTVTCKRLPWSACACTQKILNFCKMMTSLGHEVYHYGAEASEVECTEHVQVISRREQEVFWPNAAQRWKTSYFEVAWDPNMTYWGLTNSRTLLEIEKRAQQQDFICVPVGKQCHQLITDRFKDRMLPVEFTVSYPDTFLDFRVFQSYAHMHRIYGQTEGAKGRNYDAVIPNYYDPADFEVTPSPDNVSNSDYVLFVGHMKEVKGLDVLQALLPSLEKRGLRLVCAGQAAKVDTDGNISYAGGKRLVGPNVRFEGLVDFDRRRELMAGARALIAPSHYMEPFGGVAVEAQLCGCPAITTDWGAFVETIENGKTGFRCHTLKEFVAALGFARHVDRQYIRKRALAHYSIDVVRHMYQHYFEQLYDLWEGGWSNLKE